MPYGVHTTGLNLVWTRSSLDSYDQTPSDVDIRSPGMIPEVFSPAMYQSLSEASLMPVVKQERSMMLVHGRLPELLTMLSQTEQM